MIDIGIVGGTGYTGAELLRLLVGHPQARLKVITSRAEAGMPVAQLFPALQGHVDLAFSPPDTAALRACDVVFFAAPNGTAMGMAPALLDSGTRVIDLAADFRLRDAEQWTRWYGMPHACPELLSEAVYGLPEVHRERIAGARLVANPGCYPTAVQLGFLPLLEEGLVEPGALIADAKSGVSGAGRQSRVESLFAEVAESVKAYGVLGHRHLPEITQALQDAAGTAVGLTFVPHLMPMIRGIHATLYARLVNKGVDLQALYARRYASEPFVHVLAPGVFPQTRHVRGANTCHIAVAQPGEADTVVVMSVIDNLVKGAAGQAIQNMNIMCGFPEIQGLEHAALFP